MAKQRANIKLYVRDRWQNIVADNRIKTTHWTYWAEAAPKEGVLGRQKITDVHSRYLFFDILPSKECRQVIDKILLKYYPIPEKSTYLN